MREGKEINRGRGRRCQTFNGEKEEYDNWRMQVEDWLVLEEGNLKYSGIEIRLCLKGRALRLSESIKREDLKKKGGEREILKVLDNA